MLSRAAYLLGGCLVATVPLSCSTPQDATPPRPNVIVLTVDTLRADHLALYGYPRSTTPAVDAFAASATVFDNAIVPRGSTRPSYASMLTGLYPFHHGVRSNGRVLHESVVTLAEVLRAAGYHTAGFVSNFVLLGEMSGLDQGFDVYDDRLEQRWDEHPEARVEWPNYERTAAHTLAAILGWLASGPPEPFCLFVNFIDPHGPYRPPARYRELFRSGKTRLLHPRQIPPYVQDGDDRNFYDYVDRYDGEIRLTDDAIAEVIRALRAEDLWEEALVVFTADHGEAFGEHLQYFEHHWHLWEETTRVPLVIRLPRAGAGAPRRVRSVASPMDLLPTVAAYLGLEIDGELDGESLLPAVRGDGLTDRMLFVEFPDVATPFTSHANIYAVRSATHKLIRVEDQRTGALMSQGVFDIVGDPLEQQQIAYDADDPVHRELSNHLDAMVDEARSFEPPFPITEYEMPLGERPAFFETRAADPTRVRKELTPDQVEKLRALGYVK
jgi:arylsulfatase A-like enzyme